MAIGAQNNTNKKEILKLIRERQIIHALKKIKDAKFYYISLTDMMNSLLIQHYLNNKPTKKDLPVIYHKLIEFIENWTKENSLDKENINNISESIKSYKIQNSQIIFNYLKSLGSFRDALSQRYKKNPFNLFLTMQSIGNNLRKTGNPFSDDAPFDKANHLDILAEEAGKVLKFHRKFIKNSNNPDKRTYYLMECFRNPSEIKYIRKRFYEFYLLAIYEDEEERFKRAKPLYNLTVQDCVKIDKSDQGSNYIKAQYKQNVKQCVNIADIVVTNKKLKYNFYQSLLKYYALIQSPGCIKPTHMERNMHIAYSMSLNSTCISRQVGAVVVKDGDIIGAGWNDTEHDRVGCIYRFRSDISRLDNSSFPIISERDYDEFRKFILKDKNRTDHSFCYKDEYGEFKKIKKDVPMDMPPAIEKFIKEIETRSLQHCRALHAEENAILQISRLGGIGVYGSTIYTTTFPCELCAKKIRKVGIKRVVYCEPYPKSVSRDVFFKEGTSAIEIKPFEGVKSPSFFRLFKPPFDIKDLQYLEIMSMK